MQVEEVILSNNRNNPNLKYDSYHFLLKNKGKTSASFVCVTSRCYASISLSADRIFKHLKDKLFNKEIIMEFKLMILSAALFI